MSDLNESQERIANELEGMIVVDAGPGTGKTKTIVQRYVNIIEKDVNPKDVILLTFTRNAAAEMEDRIKGMLSDNGMADISKDLRTSTFDSFCYSIVMESPETVSRFFGIKEKLTRSATTVENETLNKVYFSDFMDRFLADRGEDYGDQSIIVSQNYSDLYELINKLMARGIVPVRGGWFGGDDGKVFHGDVERIRRILEACNEETSGTRVIKYLLSEKLIDDSKNSAPLPMHVDRLEPIPQELLEMAINDDNSMLMDLVHDVYYEFIRRSVIDDRLTFGLVASFAFVVLYSDKGTRERMRCRYLMIDEFQDTNSNQFMIALMLMKEPNLCVVGDWKQGIYGFRYVSIENITRFDERSKSLTKFLNDDAERVMFTIPDAISYSLDTNYRSSQKIIDCAYKGLYIPGSNVEVIDVNALDRDVVKIKANKSYLEDHSEIEFTEVESSAEEVQEVLRKIDAYVKGDYRICEDENTLRPVTYGDIAVLCRTSTLARAINYAAMDAGIPMFLQGDVDIMGSREGKLLLAWLRFVNNERDVWGLGTILADEKYPLCDIQEITSFEIGKLGIPEDIVQLRNDLIKKKRRITSMISAIYDHYGLNNDVTQTIITVISSAHRGSLLTISDIIRMIETDIKNRTAYSVDSFLNKKAVIIQTMHKSKGLEYPVVIIAGMDVGLFPNTKGEKSKYRFTDLIGVRCTREVYDFADGLSRITDSWKTKLLLQCEKKDYSEERRLLFVAISRAKQYITMVASKKSTFFKGLLECGVQLPPGIGKVLTTVNMESESLIDRPVPDVFTKRRKNIGVHDILHFEGDNAPPEGSDQVCGKGMEYGKKVHHAAELMARSLRLDPEYSEFPEISNIKKVLDSVKDAVYIEPEIECTLPFNDINVTLRGIIDLYVEFSDRVEIHDYKTDVSDLYEHEYKVQLSVYAYAAHEFTGKNVKCIIDYISRNERVEFDPIPIEQIIDRLKEFE